MHFIYMEISLGLLVISTFFFFFWGGGGGCIGKNFKGDKGT